jgi:hypothetical protein
MTRRKNEVLHARSVARLARAINPRVLGGFVGAALAGLTQARR